MAHRPRARRSRQIVPDPTKRLLTVVVAIVAVATAAALLALWPDEEEAPQVRGLGFTSQVFEARVVEARTVPCEGTVPEAAVECRRTTFELLEGPEEGTTAVQELTAHPTAPELRSGDEVLLGFDPAAEEGFRYRYVDRKRSGTLAWLTLLFAAAVLALGRFRGLAALAGLGASILVVVQFVLPAVLSGRSPVLVAVVGAAAVAFLALYLAHGFNVMTTVALLGTLGALALTTVLAALFVAVTQLTGFATEEATVVQIGAAEIDLAGILLGGVVIGALGAIDDVTVTQASAVWELRRASPGMSRPSLVRSGLRIGRDHIASTVNTLALAYVGASMPVLLLLVLSRQPVGTVINGEVIATEIVRTLVGSIGLVAAVPITTWLAAAVAPGSDEAAPVPAGAGGEGFEPPRASRP